MQDEGGKTASPLHDDLFRNLRVLQETVTSLIVSKVRVIVPLSISFWALTLVETPVSELTFHWFSSGSPISAIGQSMMNGRELFDHAAPSRSGRSTTTT